MRRVLDLCTGIGGFSLAGKWLIGDWRTVCYVEIDKYCQQVLRQRIKDGYLDDATIYSDLRTFDGTAWRGCVDIITAGFPCQPFSVAGKQQGEADERNLWPDVWRIIRDVGPGYVFLENVPGLLANKYIGQVFGDLAACGYNIRWDCIPASAVGANHQRDRLWIVAHSQSVNRWDIRKDVRNGTRGNSRGQLNEGCIDAREVADATSTNTRRQWEGKKLGWGPPLCDGRTWWAVEPDVGRVAHGVPDRVGRLRALGNSVVPAVVAKAWEILNGD